MKPPDVVGLIWEDALQELNKYHPLRIETVFTEPPHGGRPSGNRRVIQQRGGKDGTIVLVVAYENYNRGQAKGGGESGN
ncbi:hypothetical protein Desca_1510 [Calderihabitans maritimus]|uniref:Uncharacterized protein n=1 Tax=Calderihabitans maritimus TaxID=1246530 RepID=A0A1Z5HXR0_9FIRM|nr:hypothetical protein Desca_1510 [Calderihabitans maritimus]